MKTRRPQAAHQWLIIGVGLAMALVMLVLPLALIFAQAFSEGVEVLLQNLSEDYMKHAIGLTVFTALITVPLNIVFGIAIAWCVTRYEFRGRRLLMTLVDIPFSMSPVVAGMCYLALLGTETLVGQWLYSKDIQVIFAWPGIILVTLFVTSPYVARILIPLLQAQGTEEEVAAVSLGASGWQILTKVTLPNIKWALLYGAVITNARAVGEFGAVSVVSGTIMNQTLTLPLLVEQLNNDYKTAAAFTAAALLACIAILTLFLKSIMEYIQKRRLAEAQRAV